MSLIKQFKEFVNSFFVEQSIPQNGRIVSGKIYDTRIGCFKDFDIFPTK